MQNMSLYGGNPQQAMYAHHGNHMVSVLLIFIFSKKISNHTNTKVYYNSEKTNRQCKFILQKYINQIFSYPFFLFTRNC